MPLVPLIKAADFDEALEMALELEQGYKHTATIHSESIERLNRAAKKMQTSVFVKTEPLFWESDLIRRGIPALPSPRPQERELPQRGILHEEEGVR